MEQVKNISIKDEYEKMNLKYYSPKEELLNCISHTIGIISSLIIMCFMIIESENTKEIYIATTSGLLMAIEYLVSAAYHGVNKNLKFKLNLRKIDYPAVNLNILACGTPLCLTYNTTYGYITYAACLILIGITLIGCTINFKKFRKISIATSYTSGLLLLIAYIIDRIHVEIPEIISYLYLGGLLASIAGGILFKSKKQYTHTIFHILVLIGSTLCLLANYYQIKLI